MILYGLETCTVCQKAFKALQDAGRDVSFRDVRAAPLSDSELATLIAEFGDNLVDRSTNDWRALSDWLRHSEAEEQIAAKPKLMARPVIQHEDQFYLGWDDQVRGALL